MSSGAHAMGYSPGIAKDDVHVSGRRIIATFIDGIILAAVYNSLVLLFGNFQHPRAWEWNGTLDAVLPNALYAIGVVLYFVVMEGYLGQTIGKMVTGIAIVREDGVTPPGIAAASIRTILRLVDGLLGYAVAFMAVISTQKRQRLGDMAARTLVVRKH